jgi:cell division protein FtsN
MGSVLMKMAKGALKCTKNKNQLLVGMKNLNLLLFLLLFSFVSMTGCKTQKIPKPQPVVQEKEKPAATAPSTKPSKANDVSSKEERISNAKGEMTDYGSNKYFVILGSFSVLENAKRLKETLVSENFSPGIVVNESGMYRVCGNSYDDETTARARITEVREKFPKYSDIWLLIRKQ